MQRFFYVLFFVVFLVASTVVKAQFSDYGLGIGATNYKGEIAPTFNLNNTFIGINGIHRYHSSRSINLRTNVLLAGIRANGQSGSNDPFLGRRDASFRSFLLEGSFGVEYLFKDFRLHKRDTFTPYVFLTAGANIYYTTLDTPDNERISETGVLPVIPMGIGFKKALNDRWDFNLEFSTSFIFLDKINAFELPNQNNRFRVNNPNQRDIYYYLSFGLAYNFYYIRCSNPALNSNY